MRLGSLLLLVGTALSPLAALARSSTGPSVLVVLEPELKKEDYSILFKSLECMSRDLSACYELFVTELIWMAPFSVTIQRVATSLHFERRTTSLHQSLSMTCHSTLTC